jgi:hypothetical protein
MADIDYVHHKPIEYRAFMAPTGIVGRWATKKAQEVAVHSRVLAPKPGVGKGYATGELAANIRAEGAQVGRTGPTADIVAGTDHAIHVHEPTVPHIIKPRYKNALVFFYRKAGRIIFDQDGVMHPGTKGNPFLVNALRHFFGGPGR